MNHLFWPMPKLPVQCCYRPFEKGLLLIKHCLAQKFDDSCSSQEIDGPVSTRNEIEYIYIYICDYMCIYVSIYSSSRWDQMALSEHKVLVLVSAQDENHVLHSNCQWGRTVPSSNNLQMPCKTLLPHFAAVFCTTHPHQVFRHTDATLYTVHGP